MMTDQASATTALSVDDCWDLLRRHELGRLAYELDGETNIVPINYVVDGERLVFRTSTGSKLHGILSQRRVAFEIDEVAGDVARSVVVRGEAHLLPSEDELRLEQVGLRAWLGGRKPILVAIETGDVHGRCYELQRPWTRMMR